MRKKATPTTRWKDVINGHKKEKNFDEFMATDRKLCRGLIHNGDPK
jgi:hypothetical protein